MTSSSGNSRNSGDGSRPTTSGGVDNIGGGGKLATDDAPVGPNDGPAPASAAAKQMSRKRSGSASSAVDDSAPLNMTENDRPLSNQEQPDPRQGDAGHR